MRFAAAAMTFGHPNLAAIIVASVYKTITRNAEEDKETSCAGAGVREPCCLTRVRIFIHVSTSFVETAR